MLHLYTCIYSILLSYKFLYLLKVIVRLVRNLDKIKNSAARALIIWIFGEYSSLGIVIPKIAPTVLKYLAWSFPSDEVEAKLQILNTCAKVFPLLPSHS